MNEKPSRLRKAGIAVNADGKSRTAFALLSYPNVAIGDLLRLWPALAAIDTATLEQLGIDAQYSVYVERQQADVAALKRDEGRGIPHWIDFALIPGLSSEARQKLAAARPETIAQAQKIDGITPAAITLLLSIIRRGYLAKAG